MKTNTAAKTLVLVLAGAGLAFGGYWMGSNHGATESPTVTAGAAPADPGNNVDPKTGRKVLYWHDPMVPGHKFDKPGKSPFMDMQLVPVYADEVSEGGVKVSPTLQQNLGIRYATVRRQESRDAIELVGTTQFAESAAEVIQSRVTGYIDHLYVRTPMQRIKRGEPVASLFVPDWIAPQEEYLALKRAGNTALAADARQRMKAMSIPDGLIAQADRTGQSQKHLTLTSPVNGVVTDLAVRDGAMVSPGVTIAKVAGMDKVWLVAEVPEALLNSAHPGLAVEATFSGDPSRKYAGKVREILPGVSTATRTVQARLELDNRDGSLIPGMLMRVRMGEDKPVSRLLVPTEAVITTGKRSVVLVAGDNNSLQPVEVTTGRDIGDSTEILTGLNEAQRVVASGQFLIDSEASLKSILPKFAGAQQSGNGNQTSQPASANAQPPQQGQQANSPPSSSAGKVYHGLGKVEKVTAESVTFSHQPIPELKWPAMTMDFKKPGKDAFPDIKPGQDAEFSFRESNDGYKLESVTSAGRGKR
ncbi:MAG: cation efflux system transrane protein [Herminiimonas sp.]|nr:cation efflux system transrane protein [Herminiimonas sp.]